MTTRSPASMMVPGDFEVEAAGIARNRQIAEAIMAQSQQRQQGQMVSGHYIAPSWAENLAVLGKAAMGKYMQKGADDDEGDMKQRYNAGLADAMQQYMTTKQGTPETLNQGQGPLAEGLDMTPAVQADPKRAMMEAMTSQFKPLQEMGRNDMMNQGKAVMTPKEIMAIPGVSVKSKIAALNGDLRQLEAEKKFMTVNGQVLSHDDTGVGKAPVFDGRDQFNSPEVLQGPNGPLLTQTNQGTKEVKGIGGGGVTVNTGDMGSKAASTEIAKGAVGKVTKGFEMANKAATSFDAYANAKTLLAGISGGTGAEVINSAKGLMNTLGIPVDNTMTSYEQVSAALMQGVLDNISALGAGTAISDGDREFMKDIVLGKASLTKESLERAINLGLASTVNTIRGHAKDLRQLGEGSTEEDRQRLQVFNVPEPEFGLSADDFTFSPKTGKFIVNNKMATSESSNTALRQSEKVQPTQKLSRQELDEMKLLQTPEGRAEWIRRKKN